MPALPPRSHPGRAVEVEGNGPVRQARRGLRRRRHAAGRHHDLVGRLTLNLLTCFSQLERKQISERTRDRVHAARRRGRWTAGPPPLAYDVAPEGGSLVVNDEAAKGVRAIFALYAEVCTMTGSVRAMSQRGWLTKSWTTRKDRHGAASWPRWRSCSPTR
jgi:DNA invertase Pin-like site-specific DNA recombinase